MGRFFPLAEEVHMPAASSASLKFRSEHLISVPYTVNEALSKSNLDNLSYMSNANTSFQCIYFKKLDNSIEVHKHGENKRI